ncbi:hypothetical protein [Qipengyuania sp. MTN3-11]|uniref:hypothetical protein n=1 Tax=Qipengyuania sp. MTN3-11 TaxID=3056557 RepID=UPI0036F2B510
MLTTPDAVLAQQGGGAEESEPADEIVVQGRVPDREAGRDLAAEITRRVEYGTPLARFHLPVCPKVSGIHPTLGDALSARIRENASEMGLAVGGADCKSNIVVAFVVDAGREVYSLINDARWAFGTLEPSERERIAGETGFTRAWHVSVLGDENGAAIRDAKGPVVNNVSIATRLAAPVTRLVTASVVLMELAAIDGKTVEQIADFATMRALAPVTEINEATGEPESILALFSDPAPAEGLTIFDRSYLSAYYSLRLRNRPASSTLNAVGREYAEAVIDGGTETE